MKMSIQTLSLITLCLLSLKQVAYGIRCCDGDKIVQCSYLETRCSSIPDGCGGLLYPGVCTLDLCNGGCKDPTATTRNPQIKPTFCCDGETQIKCKKGAVACIKNFKYGKEVFEGCQYHRLLPQQDCEIVTWPMEYKRCYCYTDNCWGTCSGSGEPPADPGPSHAGPQADPGQSPPGPPTGPGPSPPGPPSPPSPPKGSSGVVVKISIILLVASVFQGLSCFYRNFTHKTHAGG